MYEDDGDLSIVGYDLGGPGRGSEERKLEDIANLGTISFVCKGQPWPFDTVWPSVGTGDWRSETEDIGGGTQVQVLYTSRGYKNV